MRLRIILYLYSSFVGSYRIPSVRPTCAQSESGEGELENGLVIGHAYSITGVKDVRSLLLLL